MPRHEHLAVLIACVALVAGAGCGSEEEEPRPGIPQSAQAALSRELDLVERRIEVTREESKPGSCQDVDSKSYPDIERIVAGLPNDTDPDVRRALERSIDRLKELTESECSELIEEIEKRREEAPPPVTPSPPPVQPEPEPEQTETQPPPEEEKPKEEKKPKEEEREKDEGTGGFGPDGQGPGGQGPPGQDGGGQPAPPSQNG